MYLSHYHLNVKPFQITPDPQFLWMGESHREALSIFKEGINVNKGLILLTGDVGTGKTTLINKLIESLHDNALVASVQYPGFDILDFYNFLAANFKMGKKYSNKGDFLIQFIHFLHEENAQNKKVVLIIDEAQGLSDEILDEIRLLSNLERAKVKLLNILLVGQDEMDKILEAPNNKALTESIAAKYYLGPLKKREVKEYIHFRLKIAGADYRIFNKGAIEEVVRSSQCYPRLINVICDHALLTGYVQGKNKIDAAIIKECAKEHQLQIFDDIESDKIDTDMMPAPVEVPSKTRGNYHWALPTILLLVLSLLVVAGYFSYLKTIGDDSSSGVVEATKKPAAEVTTNTPSKDKGPPVDNTGVSKTQAAPLDKGALPIIEEDLDDESSYKTPASKPLIDGKVEGNTGVAVGDAGEIQSQAELTKANETADVTSNDTSPVSADEKLVLTFPAYAEELPKDAYAQLDTFFINASQYPEARILIKGYTDSSGNARHNRKLSQTRADTVKAYFIAQGYDQNKIEAVGLGEKDPVASNETPAGRKVNRRIEIELVRPSATNASLNRNSSSNIPF